ncbi:hypothetical protein [Macellibacteroides fermentans]|uniref:Uncharacterized protein n=1 Tax=Parabacteroides chartae TaxID=1037355 RepID=A0A1T5F2R7_9BACT|nr:hypothetical protein [Parabacteroides chartae]SKB90504.1 hypothetical protein SAMN05660349_03281 [Parabacteroides chartae]
MKKYIFFIALMVFSCSANSQNMVYRCFEIDFQDFFKNDTVSLSVNHHQVFKNEILNSDFSTGITNVRVRVCFHKKRGLIVYESKSFEIDNLSQPIVLKVHINGVLNEYKINLKQGEYIGLSMKRSGGLNIYQSKMPFEYE